MKEASAYDDLIYKLVFLDSDEDKEKVYRLINHVIRETWNEALDKAAENADADIYFKGWLAEQEPFVEGEDYEVYVLNQSILKLKI